MESRIVFIFLFFKNFLNSSDHLLHGCFLLSVQRFSYHFQGLPLSHGIPAGRFSQFCRCSSTSSFVSSLTASSMYNGRISCITLQFIFSILLFLLTYLCSYHLACTVVGYSCPPGTFLIAFSDPLKGEFTIYPQMKYFPVRFPVSVCIAFEIPNCLILHDLIQYCRGCILHGSCIISENSSPT